MLIPKYNHFFSNNIIFVWLECYLLFYCHFYGCHYQFITVFSVVTITVLNFYLTLFIILMLLMLIPNDDSYSALTMTFIF